MENQKWQHNPKWNGKFSLLNASFLIITPLLTIALIPYILLNHGFYFSDFLAFSLLIFTTGISLTAGYHRYFSHQTHECHPALKLFYLIFGAACLQNSAIRWSSDHRYHHRFVDKESDPYNINRGFFYAHMGWIFYGDPEGRSFENAKDLLSDKMLIWQNKYYLLIAILIGFVLPTLIGALFGHPWTALFWGGLFRTVFCHHGTFFINSLAHMVGNRPYSEKVSARDSWWLAFFTNGEGYHNYHHAFANDYRNGIRWHHWDPTKWFIFVMYKLGLAKNLVRTPDAQILRARMQTTYEQFRFKWSYQEVPAPLETMRQNLEEKLQEFQQKIREFQSWKESRAIENARAKKIKTRYWKKRLSLEKRLLEASFREYHAMVLLLSRDFRFSR